MITGIIAVLLGLTLGGSLYLLFRRGSKVDYNPEDFVPDLELNAEEEKEVLETTFEVLEVEHEQDKEFEDNVSKIEQKIKLSSDADVVDFINGFFGVDKESNPIVVTNDKSKFDWESDPSMDDGLPS